MRAANRAEVDGWTKLWHVLGAVPFGTEAYNATLQRITDEVLLQNRSIRVRTSEALEGTREMRDFELDEASGALVIR